MHLDRVTESQTDLRGTVVKLDAVCTDGEQRVDATGKLALLVCGAPILVGVLLVLPAFLTQNKRQDGPAELKEWPIFASRGDKK